MDEAWITLASNDSYAIGALKLVQSLKKFGSVKKMHCLVTREVSQDSRADLDLQFDETTLVDTHNSRDTENLALINRPDLGVTFTKLHCWRLTQYTKAVFLDADTLVVQNCDELFESLHVLKIDEVELLDIVNSKQFLLVPLKDDFTRLQARQQQQLKSPTNPPSAPGPHRENTDQQQPTAAKRRSTSREPTAKTPASDNTETTNSHFQANERVQEVEAKWITDKEALDRRLLDLVNERDRMEKDYVEQKGTWTRTMNEKDRQIREDRKRLEQKITELEAIQKTMQAGLQVQQQQQAKSPPTPPPPASGPHRENTDQQQPTAAKRRSTSREPTEKTPASDDTETTDSHFQANEQVQEVEAKWITDKEAFDRRLLDLVNERDRMEKDYVEQKETWTRTMNEKDRQIREDRKRLEQKITELEAIQKTMQAGLQVQQQQQAKSPPTPPPPASGPHRENTDQQQPTAAKRRSTSREPTAKTPVPPPPPPPPPIAGLVTSNGNTVPIPPPPPPPGGFAPSSDDTDTRKKVYKTKNNLSLFHWEVLKLKETKNTVFETLNDELVIEKIDFTKLEEMFRIQEKKAPAVSTFSTSTITDEKRLQIIAISRRIVELDSKSIMAAVHQLDLETLSAKKVDILARILPTSEERRKYAEKKGELAGLSEEDVFLAALCEIEGLERKLNVMRIMAEFDETAALLQPQLMHVTAASKCAREAKDFHGVLEVILAFGNYMNSGKRGGAYGFKLSSLDSLYIQKASKDRTISLLHLIVASIEQSLPELSNFAAQLEFVDKMTTVQWDVIRAGVKKLETGFKLASDEKALKGADCPDSLVRFLEARQSKMDDLLDASRLANKTYDECVEFYGENAKSTPPNVFFQKLASFVANYARCKQENEAKQTLEKKQREEAERRARLANNKDQQQQDMMMEAAERVNGASKQQRANIDSTRMDHGDFENGVKETGGTTPNRRKTSKSPSPAPRQGIVPPPVAPKTRVLSVERDRQ